MGVLLPWVRGDTAQVIGAEREDVHAPPSVDLRSAMALAASRDSIAQQYASGYADLFQLALPCAAQLRPCLMCQRARSIHDIHDVLTVVLLCVIPVVR